MMYSPDPQGNALIGEDISSLVWFDADDLTPELDSWAQQFDRAIEAEWPNSKERSRLVGARAERSLSLLWFLAQHTNVELVAERRLMLERESG